MRRRLTLLGFALGCAAAEDGAEGTVLSPGHTRLIDVAELEVSRNPVNGLSCAVRFTTAEPTRAWIELGAGERRELRIRGESEGTSHAITAIGMRPETSYALDVYVESLDGTAGGVRRATCTTGGLPGGVEPPELVLPGPDTPETPWFSATPVRTEGGPAIPSAPVWFEPSGSVVWYGQPVAPSFFMDPMPSGRAFFVSSAQPSIVGWDGVVTWAGDAFLPKGPQFGQPGPVADGDLHHDVRLLENGHLSCLRYDVRDGRYGDTLAEVQIDGTPVWTWKALDYLSPPGTGDVLHGNALIIDHARGFATYSAKSTDAIYLVDLETNAIRGTLGHAGDYTLTSGNPDHWFSSQHAPAWTPEGNLLVFDNRDPHKTESRVIEYAVDHEAKTVTRVWQYPPDGAPRETWPVLGSIIAMPNGNRLASMLPGTVQGRDGSEVMELRGPAECGSGCTAEQMVVRHYRFPEPYAVYRVTFGLPPGVERLP